MPEYQRNHYVPVWYQKRFLAPNERAAELHYLDLKPTTGYLDSRNRFTLHSGLHRWGPRKCFYQDDLYTTYLGNEPSTILERDFFGRIDNDGREAVDAFSRFEYTGAAFGAWRRLMTFIGAQKLRTPKGLAWLADPMANGDRTAILRRMVEWRRLYEAIWSEAVWMIADASESATKFLISDHPVTVYNRACGPRSRWCRTHNDPDVRQHATHTLFPLSLNKILILTNLSWVRNPYQNPTHLRPNPTLGRRTVFKFMDIQIE